MAERWQTMAQGWRLAASQMYGAMAIQVEYLTTARMQQLATTQMLRPVSF